MKQYILTAAMFLAFIGIAAAQTPLAERYQAEGGAALSAAQMAALVDRDPNLFVYAVQSALSDKRIYFGKLNGLMDRNTIAAINYFCLQHGISNTCAVGPLTRPTAIVLATALRGDLLLQEGLPRGWSTENHLGVAYSVLGTTVENGTTVTLVRFTGRATSDGFTNIELSRPLPAQINQHWRFTVHAAVAGGSAGSLNEITLRAAIFGADGSFRKELVSAGVSFADQFGLAQAIDVSGTITTPAGFVVPYVQITFDQGDNVDITLKVSSPQSSQS